MVDALNNQSQAMTHAVRKQAGAVGDLAEHLFTDSITVKNSPSELTLEKIAMHGLPLKVQKDFTSMFTPIAKDGEVPVK